MRRVLIVLKEVFADNFTIHKKAGRYKPAGLFIHRT